MLWIRDKRSIALNGTPDQPLKAQGTQEGAERTQVPEDEDTRQRVLPSRYDMTNKTGPSNISPRLEEVLRAPLHPENITTVHGCCWGRVESYQFLTGLPLGDLLRSEGKKDGWQKVMGGECSQNTPYTHKNQ